MDLKALPLCPPHGFRREPRTRAHMRVLVTKFAIRLARRLGGQFGQRTARTRTRAYCCQKPIDCPRFRSCGRCSERWRVSVARSVPLPICWARSARANRAPCSPWHLGRGKQSRRSYRSVLGASPEESAKTLTFLKQAARVKPVFSLASRSP